MEKLRALFKANRGMAVKLARHLGLSPSTVSQWQNVPPEHVRKIADFTGLTPSDLRPDLYGWVEPAQ
jgi:DNA-binding transcriptional regulator YdaS (Cro superfamily)